MSVGIRDWDHTASEVQKVVGGTIDDAGGTSSTHRTTAAMAIDGIASG